MVSTVVLGMVLRQKAGLQSAGPQSDSEVIGPFGVAEGQGECLCSLSKKRILFVKNAFTYSFLRLPRVIQSGGPYAELFSGR